MNPIKNSGNHSKLNKRQKKFIEFYLQTGNGSESARKAGYAIKCAGATATELLKNPNVAAELNTRMKQLEEKGMAKTEEIIKYLTSVMRGEHTDEMAMNIGIGEGKTQAEIVNLKVQSKDRLKAAEMLAKIKGMFVNKSELEVNGNIPIVIKDDI